MRDKNLNPEQLNIQLTRICRHSLQNLVLTEAVFVNPNLEYEIILGPLPRKLGELKALAFISYFVNDEAVGFYLREEIREKRLRHFSLEDQLSLEILLEGRNVAINYFHLNEEISSRTFFGNFVPLGIKLFNLLKFTRRKLGKPVKSVYRRGYKDHGSRRPEVKWLPSFDFSWTEAQNERERIQNSYNKYLEQLIKILR